MNPQRYIMPVIIAAGLHGALLLFSSPPHPSHKSDPEKPAVLPDFPRMEINAEDPPPAGNGDSAGGAEPVPSIPDIPQELPKEDIFKVEVRERIVSIAPVTKLPKNFEGIGGPEGSLSGGPKVINFTGLDRAPRATVQPPPPYPDTMRSSSTSGSVTVEFVVDTTGRVVTAEAVRWTHREFADPAVRAVLRWRFEPGTVNQRKVNFRMAVPIEFNAER